MSGFLIPLEKCPKCGRHAVLSGHYYDGREDRYGWLGKKCSYCGYEERDEEETRLMIEEFEKLEEAVEKMRCEEA